MGDRLRTSFVPAAVSVFSSSTIVLESVWDRAILEWFVVNNGGAGAGVLAIVVTVLLLEVIKRRVACVRE